GRSGIRKLTQFDVSQFEVQIGGEVRDFHPEEAIPTKDLRRMDLNGQYAVVSALEAVAQSGLVINESNRDDVGVIFGSAGGGYGFLLEQNAIFEKSGYRRVSPFLISNMLPDAASGHVAIAIGACGPNMAVASACSTGTAAIGEAWETIRRGDAEAIVAGGTDNPLLPVLLAGFHALRALANDPEHPERANKPFDARRDGFVVGQGAAALMLESLDSAEAGGAGALEAIAAIQVVRTGIIPPTLNYEVPDPECDLDYVPNVARHADVRVSLSNSVGLGGHNACVLFRRFEA